AGRAPLHPHRHAARPRAGLAHPGRRRDAGRRAVGARLAHLRGARIPQHRCDAVRHRGDRGDRACAGEAGVPAARGVRGGALGDDDMTAAAAPTSERTLRIVRGTLSVLAVAAIYEAVARSGVFPSVLLPTLPVVAKTLAGAIADGTMPLHAFYTLERV